MAKAKGKSKPHTGAKASTRKAAASKGGAAFSIVNADCVMGTISNNLENHGEERVPSWTVPVAGIALKEDQVDAYFGKYTYTSWFNRDAATRLAEPMPWWQKRENGDFPVSDKFDVDTVEIKCRAGSTFKFRSEDHKSDDGATPAGSISKLCFAPQVGGIVLLSFQLTVRPDDSMFAELIDNQKGHIKLTLGDMQSSTKKSKQGELPLVPPDDAGTESLFE